MEIAILIFGFENAKRHSIAGSQRNRIPECIGFQTVEKPTMKLL